MPEAAPAGRRRPWAGLRQRLALLARPREPEGLPVAIDRRRVYILPTGFGLFLAAVLLAMLLGGLNYNNNPALVLTLLIAAGLHNSLVRTHLNLSGLRLLGVHAEPVHAGQPITLRLELEADGKRPRPGLVLDGSGGKTVFSLPAGGRCEALSRMPTTKRGWLAPQRLTLSTTYPHGLSRAWTWLWPSRRFLVYPALEAHAPPLPSGHGDAQRPRAWSSGEELHQLRDYRLGDQLRQIAWKASAHRGHLLVREYEASTRREFVLDWSELPELAHEHRIQRLARWVVEAERLGVRYSLLLPSQRIPQGSGPDHRHSCLRALALLPEG